MNKKYYIRPIAVSVQLHDLMQVTVISGVADEDSLGRRLEENDTEPFTWESEDYSNIWK